MKRRTELGALMVGGVINSREQKKLILASGIHPEDIGDRFLASCWTVLGMVAQDGQRTNAAELFAAGVSRKMLGPDDLGVLVSLAGRSPVDDQAVLRIAAEVRRLARQEELGRQLRELGDGLIAAQATPESIHARFNAVFEHYGQLHAAGRRGSDVVVAAVEEFERRKNAGKPGMVSTGIEAIDELTGGFPLKLCVVLGPPATFKSGLMGTMLRRQLRAGLRPLVVSLEDRDTWVVKRYAAADLGMRVRDVFHAPFPDEAKAAEVFNAMANELHEAWFVTRQHVRSADDIVRVATQYRAQHDITHVFVDNARAVKPADNGRQWKLDRREEQSRMYGAFAEWADRNQCPLVLLVHTTRDYWKRTGGKSPPEMQDIGETSDAEKDVRQLLSLWSKSGRLRVTLGKQNEADRNVPTLEFSMLGESALIDPDSAERIHLEAEKREAAERAEEAQFEKQKRLQLRREKWNNERKAPPEMKAVEKPPQAELGLEVPPASKPPLHIVRDSKPEEPES